MLTIAVSSNSKLNYVIPGDPEGTRDGVVPELCRRLAEGLGVEAVFVQYESTEAQLRAAATGETLPQTTLSSAQSASPFMI